MADVKFNKKLTEVSAITASSQNKDTVYFTSDTHRIALGGHLIAGGPSSLGCGNVFICVERVTTSSGNLNVFNGVKLVRPENYNSNEDTTDTLHVIGVAIRGENNWLLVGLHPRLLKWGNKEGGHTPFITIFGNAVLDMTGETRTLTQVNTYGIGVKSPELAESALEYCYNYSELYNGIGIEATKWWLPSCGEAMQIYSNLEAINYAMNLCGGTVLNGTLWTSTEYSDTQALTVSFTNGELYPVPKDYYAGGTIYALPVTSLSKLSYTIPEPEQ